MQRVNMIPGMDSDRWAAWSHRPALAPVFGRSQMGGDPVLTASSCRFEQFGKWLCDVPCVEGGATYRFQVEYLPQGVKSASVSVHAMLTWRTSDGKPHTRDYAAQAADAGDGWKSLGRTLEAPQDAVSLTAELAFKWSDGGSVAWRRPVLERVDPLRHRTVKVASAFIDKAGSLEGNLERMLQAVDKAGAERADIVCLGETVYDWGVPLPLERRAVEIPGPLTDILGERARRHSMHIALSLNEKDGDYYYNTGLLIGRQGEIIGKYRKMQLPICEGEDGVTPGREYPVFDTDFGRIGILICWDHGFPEVSRMLAMRGAEILFLPTLWHTEIQAPARAVDNGVYVVVSAPRWTKTPCRVINPMGEVVASAMGGEHSESGLCTAVIDLDKRFYTYWLSVGAAYGEGKTCNNVEPRFDTFEY